MHRKYLAFDIETCKVQPANAVDSRVGCPLGISCAATIASCSGVPRLWHGGKSRSQPRNQMTRKEAQQLVNYLAKQVERGHTIVTWNGLGFDFDILAEESGLLATCKALAIAHVDMMFHVLGKIGFGVSLESAARGMDMAGKHEGITGVEIPRLWAEGRWQKVFDYVRQDARLVLQLATVCEERRHLRWITRSGRRRELRLPRGWLTVKAVERLPEPNAFWCRSQWSRTRFAAWLHCVRPVKHRS